MFGDDFFYQEYQRLRNSQMSLKSILRDDCEKTKTFAEQTKKGGFICCDIHTMVAKKKSFTSITNGKLHKFVQFALFLYF